MLTENREVHQELLRVSDFTQKLKRNLPERSFIAEKSRFLAQ